MASQFALMTPTKSLLLQAGTLLNFYRAERLTGHENAQVVSPTTNKKAITMEKINGYPSVMQLGHKMIAEIFSGPVLVEEKIDGSQF